MRGYASSRFSAPQIWSHSATIKSISVLQIRNYTTFATKNEFSNSQLLAIRRCMESRTVTCTAPEGFSLPQTRSTRHRILSLVFLKCSSKELVCVERSATRLCQCGASPTHRLKRQVQRVCETTARAAEVWMPYSWKMGKQRRPHPTN